MSPRQDRDVVHLKAKPELHFDVHELKVHVLRVPGGGGMYLGNMEPEVVCGIREWSRRTEHHNEVTCDRCRSMIPQLPTNPRSGMPMPRPEPMKRQR